MDRDIMIEQINSIMEKKRYYGKLREFESTAKKVLMYGPVAMFLGMGLWWPLSATLMFIYRHATDKCVKSCGRDTQCYNRCYYLQCTKVIKLIRDDMKNLKKIKDPKDRAKAEKKLRDELLLWEKRKDKWEEKIVDAKKLGK
jgi:hypothetical protein